MSKIWFDTEAADWNEALPIGNGKLGAMIFGDVKNEHLQLNEDSIWYGGKRNRINPNARENLEAIRQLIFEERIGEAEELLRYNFSGTPQSQRPYQSLGNLKICFKEKEGVVTNYQRVLNSDNAIVAVSYQMGRTVFKREYLSSYPDQVIAMQFTTTNEDRLSFDLLLTRERFYEEVENLNQGMILLKGNLGKNGVDFAIGCKAVVEDGIVEVRGEHILVRGATKATIYLAATSSYYESNYIAKIITNIENATDKGYEKIREEHIRDYCALYENTTLELEKDKELEVLTTKERLHRIKEGKEDIGLVEAYFNFGKYLLISSSRKGSLPTNLQGIWNKEMQPCWDAKYTININTQMNYWLADSCQLHECHQVLFDLLRRVMESGKITASKMYGCRGFVAHHNTDIWADTAPQDIYIPATYWVMGGAWLCTHLWSHFQYTQDKEWLANHYDILEESVLFFLDFLVEKEGYYVTCPSVSPENTYILPSGVKGCVCDGPTMDTEILRDLLNTYKEATTLLGKDATYLEKVEHILLNLPPIQVGKYGQIMEWKKDYEEEEPGHRHISQLYALHPSHQITRDLTPTLAQAAEETLKRRLSYGGGHTGWSCAWIMNFYNRLWDGENAYAMFKRLLAHSTFSNLFCNHPRPTGEVFQIDGNLGGANGIIEFFVQTNENRTLLLPACPAVLEKGNIKGVKVYGGATLDLEWMAGKLAFVKIYGLKKSAIQITLQYEGKCYQIKLAAGEARDITHLFVEK